MRLYDNLYLGDLVLPQKRRMIFDVRYRRKKKNVYLLTVPSNPRNLLDIYPSWVMNQKFFRKSDILVVGIAVGYQEAVELACDIIEDVYEKTGRYATEGYFTAH